VMKNSQVDHWLSHFTGRFREQLHRAIDEFDQSNSITSTKQKNISCVVWHGNTVQAGGVLLYRQQCARSGLEVQVVWRRRPTFGTVINDEISRQRRSETENLACLFRDTLRAMLLVSNGEVAIDDGKRIAVDGEVFELHTFLFGRQASRTQEAGTSR